MRVNQEPHPESGQYFIIEINDKPIFCKGGNFVPADMIFARLDRARYETLVDRALEANFNLLRIWGGGLYESDDFYELCDERGILVWQEFIFACAKYPATTRRSWPTSSARPRYQVRRLAHHPSLVVWCGNNEMEWGDWRLGLRAKAWPIPTTPSSTWSCRVIVKRGGRHPLLPAQLAVFAGPRVAQPLTTWATSTRGASASPTPTSASTARWPAASPTKAASSGPTAPADGAAPACRPARGERASHATVALLRLGGPRQRHRLLGRAAPTPTTCCAAVARASDIARR